MGDKIIFVIQGERAYADSGTDILYVGCDENFVSEFKPTENHEYLTLQLWFNGKVIKNYSKKSRDNSWDLVDDYVIDFYQEIEKTEKRLAEMKKEADVLSTINSMLKL